MEGGALKMIKNFRGLSYENQQIEGAQNEKNEPPPIVQKMAHFFWEPCAKVCHFKLKVKNEK